MYMCKSEIEGALGQYRDHEVMGPATITLHNLMEAADACSSDGWAHWLKPCRAAKRLQGLIWEQQELDREHNEHKISDRQHRELAVTEADVWAAYTPLKAFRTRERGKSDIWFAINYGPTDGVSGASRY